MIPEIAKDLQESELCRSDSEIIYTTLRYEFKGFTITVDGVPAVHCAELDEDIIYGPLAVEIGDVVHKLAEIAKLIAKHENNDSAPIAMPLSFSLEALSVT